MLRTVVVINIFCGNKDTVIFFLFRIILWIERSKEQNFKHNIFYIIINVFTVTFDKFMHPWWILKNYIT